MLILAPLQINYGLLYSSREEADPKMVGENDVTLDMYGWSQAGVKFQQFLKKEGIDEKGHQRVKIISNKWFPAAHLDYYIAHPKNIDLLVSGNLEEAHKYFWINKERSINHGDKVYYLTTSQQFCDPESLIWKFGKIIPRDTLEINRNGGKVKNIFVFEMDNPVKKLP